MKSKKLLSLVSAVIIAISASAQSVQYTPGDTIYGSLPASGFAKIDCYIHNLTTDSLDIGWTLLSNNLVTGWDYSLCDFGKCYPGIPASGKMKRMGTTDTAFLKVNLSPLDIPGTGTVTFLVEPKTGEKDTIVFIITATAPASVAENNFNRNISISPNPAADYIAIDFNRKTGEKSKIIITNILGETVKQENLFNEKRNILSTADLQEGIYFLSLQQNGQVAETRKIIISR